MEEDTALHGAAATGIPGNAKPVDVQPATTPPPPSETLVTAMNDAAEAELEAAEAENLGISGNQKTIKPTGKSKVKKSLSR